MDNNISNPTLIPKAKTAPKSQDSALVYFSVFLLVATLIGYITLNILSRDLKTNACKIEGCVFSSEAQAKKTINVAKISDDRKIATEKGYTVKGDLQVYQEEYSGQKKEVLEFKQKLDPFLLMAQNRKELSQIFNFLERNTLPKVQFKSFTAKAQESLLTIDGVVHEDDFTTLARQYLMLEKDKDVSSVNLANISLSREREVEFTFDIVLKPNVYKFLINN